MNYRKIPKISPGLIFVKGPFRGAYIRRGLCTEGNLRFKIDWAGLILGRKFNVFRFYLVFEGNLQVQAPGEAYIWRGVLTEGFLRHEFGGLIFGGAYFRNFTVYFFCSAMLYCNICSRIFTDKKFAQTAHNNEIFISFI